MRYLGAPQEDQKPRTLPNVRFSVFAGCRRISVDRFEVHRQHPKLRSAWDRRKYRKNGELPERIEKISDLAIRLWSEISQYSPALLSIFRMMYDKMLDNRIIKELLPLDLAQED